MRGRRFYFCSEIWELIQVQSPVTKTSVLASVCLLQPVFFFYVIFLRDLGKWHLGTAWHICLFIKDKKSTVGHVQTSRIKGELCTSLLNLQRVFNTQLRYFVRTKKESSQCTNCQCQFLENPMQVCNFVHLINLSLSSLFPVPIRFRLRRP